MPAKVFVDSNIWLYSLIQSGEDDRHQQAVDFLIQLESPVINSQVIREICSNLKKKTSIPEEQLCSLIHGWYQDCKVVHSNATQHLLASRIRSGALKNQLQHLGEVKVLGWKKQKSITSN